MNLFFRLVWVRLAALWRGRVGLWDRVRTPFRVVPTDLDVLFHMNNGKYLSLLDLGRMDLMLRSGFWKQASRRGWYPVVAGQTITYRRSLKLGQRFDLHTQILGMDERWIFLEQHFVVDGQVHAQAVIRARFLKKSGGSVMPDEVAEIAGQMPAGLTVPQWVLDWADATRPVVTFEQ